MKAMTITELAHATGGELPANAAAEHTGCIRALAVDSRLVNDHTAFCALPGERVDGHDFAGKAAESGAPAIIVTDRARAIASGAPEDRIIVVTDGQRALGDIARASLAALRAHHPRAITRDELTGESAPAPLVIGMTGSVGKTTVKDLCAALLRAEAGAEAEIVAPRGSFNNEIGLPLTVAQAGEDTRALVLEMGADHRGNIDYLTSIAPPDISLVLAVAPAHLGVFGGIDIIAQTKAEIISGTRRGGTVILNADDPRVAAMAENATGPIIYFSADSKRVGEMNVRAEDISLDPMGRARFTLVLPPAGPGQDEVRQEMALHLIGRHQVSNVLAAAAVGWYVGIAPHRIAQVLSEQRPASAHRMAVHHLRDGITLIDDAYNANPASVRAALEVMAGRDVVGRKILVLGDMLELGEKAEQLHRELAPLIARAGIDLVVTVGELAACAANECGSAVRAHQCADIEAAQAYLNATLQPMDTVLVKGSNGSHLWELADILCAAYPQANPDHRGEEK